ncbi:MAG: ABC transporter ATP-binding protein [Verrucomicrobiales bacterium]|nr:ABC transporter ATP-binding protein [Verrucomicrobiales bacterium]
MNVLQVSRLTKSYGTTPVLQGVSLSLAPGERAALMGPSGSGKSTLLNCVGGIDRPDDGEIEIDGEKLSQFDEEGLCRLRRRKVSTVFQFFHLLPTLTASENIEFPLQLTGMAEKDRLSRVAELIEEVGLVHRAGALPDELSGGEMQRVAIARALSIRPRLILADEPTGNLDSATGEAILDLLQRVSESHEIAMLIVTHSPDVTRICDQTFKMRDGLIASGENDDE